MKSHAKKIFDIPQIWWEIFLLVILNGIAFITFINIWMVSTYHPLIGNRVADVAPKTTAIILGAGIKDDGTLGPYLSDRMVAGMELYYAGVVDQILITGDDGGNREDEISAMLDFLDDRGISSSDILIDRHGYRTYESCYRARSIFDIQEAVLVTQEFHLSRALYLCQSQGIDVVGYAADRRGVDDWWTPGPRELLARVKAWWQTEITKPLPRVMQ